MQPFGWGLRLGGTGGMAGSAPPSAPSFILLEDGSKIILEDSSGFLLKES